MTTSLLKSQGPSAGGPGDQLGHLYTRHHALGRVASLEVCTLAALDRKEGKHIDPEAVPGMQRVCGVVGGMLGVQSPGAGRMFLKKERETDPASPMYQL